MASVWQVWGDLPASIRDELTPRQKKIIERYIMTKIIKPVYRVAYDAGAGKLQSDGG